MGIKVHPEDGRMSIKISRAILSTFLQAPYQLEVLTTDHTGPTGKEAHDLLLSTRLGSASKLAPGLYSLECVCREVVSPRAFDWAGVLSSEAAELWHAEKHHNPWLWQGRILVLVQMTRPCHQGGFSLHGLLLRKGTDDWERLFGWAGFARKPLRGEAGPAASASASTTPPAAAAAQRTSKAAQWQHVIRTLSGPTYAPLLGADERVQLTTSLKLMGKPSQQAKRYVDGSSKNMAWVKSDGKKPARTQDWKHMAGRRGGGQAGSGGPIHCKVAFLKDVFMKHHAV